MLAKVRSQIFLQLVRIFTIRLSIRQFFYKSMLICLFHFYSQEQLHALQHNLTEIYMKPLKALKRGIENLINTLKPVIEKIKVGIQVVKNAIHSCCKW